MTITGPLARAARALVRLPRDHVARLARLDPAALADFEQERAPLPKEENARLRYALEEGGALFLEEELGRGVGVQLKFSAKDVRAINRMEGEGGPVADDDV